VARNLDAADGRIKELLKNYSTSDAAAAALVLEGRLALARSRTRDAVNAAVASFERVPRLFPGSDAVPAAMYYAGEALRLGGQSADAISRFSQVATQFPTSIWAARALLASSLSLARAGQVPRAMEQLQRVRNGFPASPEAGLALDWNSVLNRLYVRAPLTQAPFLFSGRTIPAAPAKLRDVTDIAMDGDDNLLVASGAGVAVYAKGAQVRTLAGQQIAGLSFDRVGAVMTVHETGVQVNGKAVPFALTAPNGKPRDLKIADVVMTASGEYLVADRESKSILRFQNDGAHAGEFAPRIEARRLAINDLDEVAALDRDHKSVSLFNREGMPIRQILEKGTGYQLHDPSDVAFDRLGHLYVLDRTSVLVFSPDAAKLLATLTSKEKTSGALGTGESMALDTAGRLYVFDGKTDSVKVYR
jgi:tetratricopeptide (TPR) repeat protein